MNKKTLTDTVQSLLANNKGLLAMDESTSTANKRLAPYGLPQTEETRRSFREWIITTPELNEGISGAILFDETIRQNTKDGVPFTEVLENAGVIPGIKVDKSAIPMARFPNELITEGLDGLGKRLEEYKQMGARFAKWRAVITIGEGIPTDACLHANAHALARYAAICQDKDIVPIVEPEVLMDGNHTLQRCFEVTENVLHAVFRQLHEQNVFLEGLLLKPNMVISGKDAAVQATTEEVAKATVDCFLRAVPAAVPGIAFLSGGQSAQQATSNLNAINKNHASRAPWVITFSFSRALEFPAVDIWKGKKENVGKAQKALYHRVMCNHAARQGLYNQEMES